MQTTTIKVPVCFYNVAHNKEITAEPESVAIQIRGKRADIKQCTDLALHINAQELQHSGEYKIAPNEDHLFLPKNVNLLHYKPLMISLNVVEKIH